ncbi:hypothetical protein FJT64_027745 [Amphibalanus amphitrite]|uniref:Uncharacterized protein n=1 Tax=Amphibalanus amphitrite TaxID=1232801 RepID=A0A6A4W6X5_AMPAM|nr:hypothetical protein FJT64_027745 [Amphibalanus amphitrite]
MLTVKRQLSSQEPLVTYQSVPKTSFSCDLVGPGYYADMETQCQVFVCDWSTNVDCPSSRDFYSLNSRIGSDEPFHTDVFVGGRLGGSTNRRPGGSTDRLARISSIPDGQLGSQSQARLKAVKPDGAKQKFDTTSNIRPPLSSPELPNSILGAFSLPEIDEYGPEPPTTAPPRLPPMNLLPLSDEPPPPTTESRLPSTTESYGVLDEGEDRESSAPPANRRELGLTRRLNIGENINEIEVERKPNQRPSEEPTTSETDRFQYNFDSVRNTLQDRLKNVEPFDVPADTLATSDRATVATQRGSSGGSVALLAPWLFSLAEVPM